MRGEICLTEISFMAAHTSDSITSSASAADLYAKAIQQEASGQLRLAEKNYRAAIANNSDFAEAENRLGCVLVMRGQEVEALGHFQQALALKPGFALAFLNFAQTLFMLGERNAAPQIIKFNTVIHDYVERAKKAWPTRLSIDELFSGGAMLEIAKEPVLLFYLGSTRLRDAGIEQLLTAIRSALLEKAVAANGEQPPEDEIVGFSCALSRQCFINEYVFSQTAREVELAAQLEQRISSALQAGEPVAVHLLAIFASYFPLNGLPAADILLKKSWPPVFQAIVIQQLIEPAKEKQLRENIPQLTEIEDEISLKVRAQYEENPYPRWVVTSSTAQPIPQHEYLRVKFPWAEFEPLEEKNGLDILVAGCGTGRTLTGMAQLLKNARVLAVDLSIPSLGYAKRMTEMLHLNNIAYAQADILRLPSIGRTFDLISVTGVMHHMADPFAAWRGLVSMLRPGGYMHIGLYSELGRQMISQAWQFIEERGYGNSADEIRRCREDIMGLPDNDPIKQAILAPDFYSLSDCRDLLFHTHELRMSIPQIKQFLADNGLKLISFDTFPETMSEYVKEFPKDNTRTNLDHWHKFEEKHPSTFANMYQFWVQKSAAVRS